MTSTSKGCSSLFTADSCLIAESTSACLLIDKLNKVKQAISDWLEAYEEFCQKLGQRPPESLELSEAYDALSSVNHPESQARLLARLLIEEHNFDFSGLEELADLDDCDTDDDDSSLYDYDSNDDDSLYDDDTEDAMEELFGSMRRAVQDLQERRFNLRARAMQLSVSSLRPLSLVDMPQEILVMIFRHVRTKGGRKPHWDSCYTETVKHCRLTCRWFNELASSELVPFVQVLVDQESLDHLQNISKHPLLAPGVETVTINLACYAAEYAGDMTAFARRSYKELREIQENSKPVGNLSRETIEEIVEILAAWSIGIESADDMTSVHVHPTEGGRAAWEVLRNAHAKYAERCESQQRLLENGTFIRKVTDAFSRMPKARHLNFIDAELDWASKIRKHRKSDILDCLCDLLPSPHSWRTLADPLFIDSIGEDLHAGIPTASVLCDLPIALHEIGVRLLSLVVPSIPTRRGQNFSHSRRKEWVDSDEPMWTELAAAFANLEYFHFGPQLRTAIGPDYHLDGPQGSQHLGRFILCALSGQALRHLNLSFADFYPLSGETRHNAVHGVFQGASWPRLRSLRVEGMSLSQAQLRYLCGAAAIGGLSTIRFEEIEVTEGGWVAAIDLLFERTKSFPRRVTRSGRQVPTHYPARFDFLSGGESGWENDSQTIEALHEYFGLGKNADGSTPMNPLRRWMKSMEEA